MFFGCIYYNYKVPFASWIKHCSNCGLSRAGRACFIFYWLRPLAPVWTPPYKLVDTISTNKFHRAYRGVHLSLTRALIRVNSVRNGIASLYFGCRSSWRLRLAFPCLLVFRRSLLVVQGSSSPWVPRPRSPARSLGGSLGAIQVSYADVGGRHAGLDFARQRSCSARRSADEQSTSWISLAALLHGAGLWFRQTHYSNTVSRMSQRFY